MSTQIHVFAIQVTKYIHVVPHKTTFFISQSFVGQFQSGWVHSQTLGPSYIQPTLVILC